MPKPKESIVNGNVFHYSVGAIIMNEGKYLLINRKNPPPGFAAVTGHIDEGEEPSDAIIREVREESGLQVTKSTLLFDEMVDWNKCSRDVTGHYWYLYMCETTGSVSQNINETNSIGWYSVEEIKKLDLEPVWKFWFEKMKII